MADIYCIIPHFLAYKGLKSTNSIRIRFNQAEESKYEIMIPFEWKKSIRPPLGGKIARNLTYMTGIKENGIKHCYRADKGDTLLEPSLKVLFIKYGWGATFKSQRMDVKCRKCKWLPSLAKVYYLSFYTT